MLKNKTSSLYLHSFNNLFWVKNQRFAFSTQICYKWNEVFKFYINVVLHMNIKTHLLQIWEALLIILYICAAKNVVYSIVNFSSNIHFMNSEEAIDFLISFLYSISASVSCKRLAFSYLLNHTLKGYCRLHIFRLVSFLYIFTMSCIICCTVFRT